MLQVKPNESWASGNCDQFQTTHWSVVLLSAQTQVPGSRTALAGLCQLYWYPLYAYIRRRGHSAEDAQDLTQGFSSVCWNASCYDKWALRKASFVRFF